MMNNTFVSVVMPVYNGALYIKQAIDSILNQTYSNFELIILNDGSTDTTENIILSFTDPRIVYIKNPENYKLIKTLNFGFSIAKGAYIARMDADDISHPERIRKQVEFLEKHSDFGLVGTGVNLLTTEKKELLYHTDHLSLTFALAFYCPFVHPSIMIRKEVLEGLDVVFDNQYLHAEDYELWTRLAFRTKMTNLPEYLLDYRIHDAQISSQHSDFQTDLALEIRRKYLEKRLKQNVNEFDFIFKLTNRNLTITDKYLQIQKLYSIDKKKSLFGGANLSRYLIQMWKNVFLETSSLQGKDFYFFLTSRITWRSTWSIRQLFAIFLKTFK